MKQWNVGSALGVALLVVALGVGGTVTVAVAGKGQA
jgi:hypothetical protein